MIRTQLARAYRRFAPTAVRESINKVRQLPEKVEDDVRARRRRQADEVVDRWKARLQQPLDAPLTAAQRDRARSDYLALRQQQVTRTTRGHTAKYAKQMEETPFRLAATAAKFYCEEPLLPDHVMYESYNCRDFGGNPYAMFRYLLDHPDYQHLHHVIAIIRLDNAKIAPFVDHPRVKVVKMNTDDYIKYAETCAYFINNASFKPFLIKRPGQVYLSTWHSTLLKKLGRDTDRPWETSNVSRALVASDIHLSPNPYTTEILFNSHSVDGIVHGRVFELGYPRNDLTINVDRADVRDRLGVGSVDKVAVYAPTWRGSYVPEDTAAETIAHAEEIRARLPPGYVLYVQFHSLLFKYVKENEIEGVVPAGIDTNELLGVTDLLITDYSGIFFDYLLTGNPVVFFTHDREAYSESKQGFYMDLESLPGPICDDLDTLGAALDDLDGVAERYAATYRTFQQRFVANDDGNACERAINVLFGIADHPELISTAPGAAPDPAKKNLLFYPSNLTGNGVTESFIGLMDKIDYDRFNVLVLMPDGTRCRENQQRLHRSAKLFYSNVPDGFTLEEFLAEHRFGSFGARDSEVHLSATFTRSIRRVFADLPIDVTINYHGYYPAAAARIALGVAAKRKLIYMHNDLEKDRNIKHPQLLSVFSTYPFHDAIVSVSADSLESNLEGAARRIDSFFGRDISARMVHSRNVIVPETIRRRAGEGAFVEVDSNGYAVQLNEVDGTVSGFRFDPDCHNFVCVGRLSPEKNHARLLEAFAAVVRSCSHARLYIVGTGALDSELQELAQKLGVEKQTIFTGFMSNPLGLVQRADCFVLASDIEGQPITILESLVLDKDVIATDIAGPRGLLEEGYGTLVEPTSEALAEAMIASASEQDSSARRRFDAESYVSEALDEFYSLLES